MSVAIITDSNAGISQIEAKQLGIKVVPMPFQIDGKEYLEEIDLFRDEFFSKISIDSEISTSQPAMGDITNLWDETLKDYDEIIYIPMSSGLSGSCQTAMMLAEDDAYKDKVYVLDTQRISVTQRSDVLDALALSKQGKTAKEIANILLENKMNATIYITIETFDYLKRGGRMTASAATLAGLLKIKPVLTIQGDKLDKCDTARTLKKAKKLMIDHVKEDIKNRNLGDCRIFSVYSYKDDEALKFQKELEEEFPNCDIEVHPLSLSVSCHIGPDSLALAACKKIVDR